MRRFTQKRAATERLYNKIKQLILEERPHCCQACGRSDIHISFSHRIPRSRRPDLIADKENIDLMGLECGCHDKVETGRYNELANGQEIVSYIRRVDPEFFGLKVILNNS